MKIWVSREEEQKKVFMCTETDTSETRRGLSYNASDWGDVISSVVQGSCLGPCLFVIFINDIDLAIDALSFIIKFADDSKAGRVVDSQEDREAFQQMLDRLESWSQEWQLLFNRGKCKIMHFGKNNPRMGYTMGGQALDSSRQEKDLGVLIEDNLKPSAQCAKAASKANQVMGRYSGAAQGEIQPTRSAFIR